jgi:cytochrome c oxidase subunit III
MSESKPIAHSEHHDYLGSKMGMWIFIFTELFLFGGLFLVYAVFRNQYPADFHHAALETNTFIGTLNTIVLLVSSMTVAMSITAIQSNQKGRAVRLLLLTLLLALVFMINKYFEWGHKFEYKIYPGSPVLGNLPKGELLFFGLYFMMTGLHALHVFVGMILLGLTIVRIEQGKINATHFSLHENSGLYWHLVDLIWIFLFPMMYLIT